MKTLIRTQGQTFDVFEPKCPTCGGHVDEVTAHDDLPARIFLCRQSCTVTRVVPPRED